MFLSMLLDIFPIEERYKFIYTITGSNAADYALFCDWVLTIASQDASILDEYINELPEIYPHPIIAYYWRDLPNRLKLFIYLYFLPHNGCTYQN